MFQQQENTNATVNLRSQGNDAPDTTVSLFKNPRLGEKLPIIMQM